MAYLFTIRAEHVEKQDLPTVDQEGNARRVIGEAKQARSAMGRLFVGDIGKRVYRVGRIIQVENDQQRDKRQGVKP